MKKTNTMYTDFLMQEWRMGEQCRRIHTCVRKVLKELETETLMYLRRHPKLEVMVVPDHERTVWAYFPVFPTLSLCHRPADVRKAARFAKRLMARARTDAEIEDLYNKNPEAALCFLRLRQCRRLIALGMHPKPQTRVLLVFSTPHCEETPVKLLRDQIRDHLGHVLLYLRSPKAPNDCPDAGKEWRRSIRPGVSWRPEFSNADLRRYERQIDA
jgi:hypothetical protein